MLWHFHCDMKLGESDVMFHGSKVSLDVHNSHCKICGMNSCSFDLRWGWRLLCIALWQYDSWLWPHFSWIWNQNRLSLFTCVITRFVVLNSTFMFLNTNQQHFANHSDIITCDWNVMFSVSQGRMYGTLLTTVTSQFVIMSSWLLVQKSEKT